MRHDPVMSVSIKVRRVALPGNFHGFTANCPYCAKFHTATGKDSKYHAQAAIRDHLATRHRGEYLGRQAGTITGPVVRSNLVA